MTFETEDIFKQLAELFYILDVRDTALVKDTIILTEKKTAEKIFKEIDRIRKFTGVNTASKIYEYNKLKSTFLEGKA